MNCNNKENIKRLRAIYPEVFRRLHSIIGYDFEQPFECLFLNGNFTVNKAMKLVKDAGYTLWDIPVLLMRNPRTNHYQDLHLVGIERGSVRVKFDKLSFSGRLCTFVNKGDFEELRKTPHVEAFIIVQSKKYIHKPEYHIDKEGRFKVAPLRTKSMYYGQDEYYTIDKSGYILDEKREDLRRRAKELRLNREKAAYLQMDNTGRIEELQAMIDNFKMKVVSELQVVQTAKQADAISRKLGYFGLEGILYYFESYKEAERNHRYNNIGESERAYLEIKDKINSL